MPKAWGNGAPLPSPFGALGQKDRSLSGESPERASRYRIQVERIGAIHQQLLNELWVADGKRVHETLFDAGDSLLVEGAWKDLDVIAQERAEAGQAGGKPF